MVAINGLIRLFFSFKASSTFDPCLNKSLISKRYLENRRFKNIHMILLNFLNVQNSLVDNEIHFIIHAKRSLKTCIADIMLESAKLNTQKRILPDVQLNALELK